MQYGDNDKETNKRRRGKNNTTPARRLLHGHSTKSINTKPLYNVVINERHVTDHTLPELSSTHEHGTLTLYRHIKTAQQRTTIRSSDGWAVTYSTQGGPRPLSAVPNVTAHPSTASVHISHYSMWHYN